MKLLTREALLSFRRAPLLSTLSITTIAFSLFTLGLFGLVAINLREALRGLEERVEIVAFVLRGTPAETITRPLAERFTVPHFPAEFWASSSTPVALPPVRTMRLTAVFMSSLKLPRFEASTR